MEGRDKRDIITISGTIFVIGLILLSIIVLFYPDYPSMEYTGILDIIQQTVAVFVILMFPAGLIYVIATQIWRHDY